MLSIDQMELLYGSLLLGIGLAMDAFSVSCADGMAEAEMSRGRMCLIAGTFALFQCGMPLAGYFLVRTALGLFETFAGLLPWISFALLLFIGGNLVKEGVEAGRGGAKEETSGRPLSGTALLLQGIATSIDALSVGFTIASYSSSMAAVSALIIGAVTFVLCMVGLRAGKWIGVKARGKAQIAGGVILIGIGIRILVQSFT